MLGLHVAFALFGAFMLLRHLPAVVRAVRAHRTGQGAPPALVGAIAPMVNVLLALAILGMAVKGLVTVLIWR